MYLHRTIFSGFLTLYLQSSIISPNKRVIIKYIYVILRLYIIK